MALLGALAVAALALAGGTSAKPQAAPFKAAWIYVGPHNDAGWSQAHDMGRLYVQKQLGTNVKTTYKENIANGAQLQQTVASLVRDGNKIIFGTSFGFFDKKLAAKYPNVIFEQATGLDQSKNLGEYFGAAEDSIYLSGYGCRRSLEERQDRLHRPVRDPRGDPACERLRARRPGHASRRHREADLDERVVRSGQGEEGSREPRRLGRRRARSERGQPCGRPVRAVEGDPVGRL